MSHPDVTFDGGNDSVLGRPEDIAAVAVFLCSEDGEFITGRDIFVDGGMTCHMPYYSDFEAMKLEWGVDGGAGAELPIEQPASSCRPAG